jgi:hypothetical protein
LPASPISPDTTNFRHERYVSRSWCIIFWY